MAVDESITEEEVIRIGPSNPDGWRRAAELGLLDDDYLEPVYVKPMSYKFLEGIPVSKPAQPVDPLKYHQRRARATPRWLTYEQRMEMRSLYKSAAGTKKRKNGKAMSVDHIVPLSGCNVCGLHVPWNLRLIPLSENQRKNNLHQE